MREYQGEGEYSAVCQPHALDRRLRAEGGTYFKPPPIPFRKGKWQIIRPCITCICFEKIQKRQSVALSEI